MKQIYCSFCFHIIGLPDNYLKETITCPACGEEVAATETAVDPEAQSRARIISRPSNKVIGEVAGFVVLIVVCVLAYMLFVRGDSKDQNTEQAVVTLSEVDDDSYDNKVSQGTFSNNSHRDSSTMTEIAANQKDSAEYTAETDLQFAENIDEQAQQEDDSLQNKDVAIRNDSAKELNQTGITTTRSRYANIEPTITWLAQYPEATMPTRTELTDATNVIKQITMGNNTAWIGVGFGPEVADANDPQFLAFKSDVMAKFTKLLDRDGTSVSPKSLDQDIAGCDFEMFKASRLDPMVQIFIGVQNNRAVFYWYHGPRIPYKKFRAGIGQATYSLAEAKN